MWVDALAQARRLSGYQAAEINAGRGEQLRVGPYIIWQPLQWPLYAGSFRRNAVTGDWVRLVVAEKPASRAADGLAALETLATRSGAIPSDLIAPVIAAGADGNRRWAVSSWDQGCSASAVPFFFAAPGSEDAYCSSGTYQDTADRTSVPP